MGSYPDVDSYPEVDTYHDVGSYPDVSSYPDNPGLGTLAWTGLDDSTTETAFLTYIYSDHYQFFVYALSRVNGVHLGMSKSRDAFIWSQN